MHCCVPRIRYNALHVYTEMIECQTASKLIAAFLACGTMHCVECQTKPSSWPAHSFNSLYVTGSLYTPLMEFFCYKSMQRHFQTIILNASFTTANTPLTAWFDAVNSVYCILSSTLKCDLGRNLQARLSLRQFSRIIE